VTRQPPSSTARLDESGLLLRRSWGACLAGACRRELRIERAEITKVRMSTARDVSRGLFIRVMGTYLWPTIAMGWFTRRKMSKRWAWVWLVPKQPIVVIETSRNRPSLVAVPLSWFGAGGVSPSEL
jgi:hypothetical protein